MSGHIRVNSGFTYRSAYVHVTAAGVYPIDLTDFGSVNWADIDMIRLELFSSYLSGGGVHTETISDFRVIGTPIPKPTSLTLLLAVGALPLLRRRS